MPLKGTSLTRQPLYAIGRYDNFKKRRITAMRSFMKLAACSVLVCLLTISCATEKKGLKISEDFDLSKNPNKSIVFGKIELQRKGVPGIPSGNEFELVRRDRITNFEKFSNNEYFFLSLEPGEYNLRKINLYYGGIGLLGLSPYFVPVGVMINVDKPNDVIYIGKLTVEFKLSTQGPRVSQNATEIRVTVSDEYNQAVNEFRKLYPNIKNEIIKNLMR
jgi:hypothetical protein